MIMSILHFTIAFGSYLVLKEKYYCSIFYRNHMILANCLKTIFIKKLMTNVYKT